jgi:hypothetical protein
MKASGAEGKGGDAPPPTDWSKVPPIPEANAGRVNPDYVPPGTAGGSTMALPQSTRGLSNVGRNALIGVIMAGLLAGAIFAFTGPGSPAATTAPGATASGPPPTATGASPTAAATAGGLDLAKIRWAIYTEAQRDSDGTGACRYLVSARVQLQALGSSPEETQALLGYVLGKTAIVRMAGPGLPEQIEVPLTTNGANIGEFGIVTKATSGAVYQTTLVSAAGIPLDIAGGTFTNPCK